MRFGMQFYPLPAAPQTAAYAKRAMSQYPFARLWVPDHLTHENPFVTLAAILAETRAACRHVGDQPGLPDAGGPRLQFQRLSPSGRRSECHGRNRRGLLVFRHDS